MAVLTINSTQLAKVGRYRVVKNFVLFPFKKGHVRLDLQRYAANTFSIDAPGRAKGVWQCKVSSFHVKFDSDHTVFWTEDDLKIVDDVSDYQYFKYMDGGVWQPIWGYSKREQQNKGKTVWKQNSDLGRDEWAESTAMAREFLEWLSDAVGTEQGMAMGPIQGTGVNLVNQL